MKPQPSKDKKSNRRLAAATILVLAGMAILTVKIWPWMMSLSTPAGQADFEAWIDSLGFGGWLVMLGLQILQVVVAIIPGEPIEIIMGVLYGTWGGFFTCELGVLLGSVLVFWAVRLAGAPLVKAVFGEEKLNHYAFLQNTKKLETVTFILFFIPGTPKDVLTYVAGLTSISPLRFLGIAMFARVPSILSSTWGGSSLAQGKWLSTVLIFAAVGLISLAGIWAHKKFMARLHRYEQADSAE